MADAMQKKNLDSSPDEVKTFDHGEVRAVSLGAFKVMRGVLQPGFKWSEHIKPLVQTDSCQVEHNAILLSRRIKTVMEDGSEMEIGPRRRIRDPSGTRCLGGWRRTCRWHRILKRSGRRLGQGSGLIDPAEDET